MPETFTCKADVVSGLMSELLPVTEPGDTIITDEGDKYVRAQQYYWYHKGTEHDA